VDEAHALVQRDRPVVVGHHVELDPMQAAGGRPSLCLRQQCSADALAAHLGQDTDDEVGREPVPPEVPADQLHIPDQVAAPVGHDHGRILRPAHVSQMTGQRLDRGVPLVRLQEHERGLFVQALLQLHQRRSVVRPGGAQDGASGLFAHAAILPGATGSGLRPP
jgi:hypothetical protein